MTVAENPDAKTQGEAPTWAWPVYAFVAWLATMLGYVARFKRARRTHRFRQDWRDSWEGLRQSEWLRDQLIAQGLAQLLAGQPLELDDTRIELTPPATYGGPCPRTPFEMNRRFLALARWAADPEAIIRERYRRLVDNALAAHASTDALRAAHHEAEGVAASSSQASLVALILSSDRRERPSKDEGGLTTARGPPIPQFATHYSPQRSHATENAPPRLQLKTSARGIALTITHNPAETMIVPAAAGLAAHMRRSPVNVHAC